MSQATSDSGGPFGPQSEHIEALMERCRSLTDTQLAALGAARDAARGAAREAAWDATLDAAWGAAWGATWDAAWGAAWNAVCALLVRDLLGATFTSREYDILTWPWRIVVGPIHPDDNGAVDRWDDSQRALAARLLPGWHGDLADLAATVDALTTIEVPA